MKRRKFAGGDPAATLSATIPVSLRLRLNTYAKRRDMSICVVVERALRRYLGEREAKAKDNGELTPEASAE